MAGQIEFRQGEVDTALEILRECAAWLDGRGQHLWEAHDITRESILQGIGPQDLYVGYRDGHAFGTMIIQWKDPIFWPELPEGVSGFVHKLAVRRSFKGQGGSGLLLDHAREVCRMRGVAMLRLDCDNARPSLKSLYEKNGFVQVGTRGFRHFTVALYQQPV